MEVRRVSAAILVAALVAALPAAAVGAEPAQPPPSASLVSLNESAGCGDPQGFRGPFATSAASWLPKSERILGPWGDVFGRTIGDAYDRLVPVRLPASTLTLYIHEAVLPAFQQVVANLEREAAAGRTYHVRSWDSYSYNPATIPPGRHLSFHAVGAAIDLNATTNPYRSDNVLITDMPSWFVKAWTDAGWCWGGDWQTIKDPMHFSWRGPRYTPGYAATPPIRPLVPSAAFTARAALGTVPSSLGGTILIGDIDRDGAVEPVSVAQVTTAGHLRVSAATAAHDLQACATFEQTEVAPSGSDQMLLADRDADGRSDLWVFDASGAFLAADVFTQATQFHRRIRVETSIPVRPGDRYLVDDHDRDGRVDLYVIRTGPGAAVEVWRGETYANRIGSFPLGAAVGADWRLGLGDRDLDGIPDLYGMAPGDDQLLVATGGSGFATAGVDTAVGAHWNARSFGVADVDGDGHDDLVFVDADGTMSIYRGGASSGSVKGWFSESWNRHWYLGLGCGANELLGPPAASADGRFVAFASDAPSLVPGDVNGAGDVFVLDTATGALEIVSVAAGGIPATGDGCGAGCSRHPAISADGRFVAFESDASNLVPGDRNGVTDVFVHDRDTGSTERVSVATGGAETACAVPGCEPWTIASSSPDLSSDGRYVVFESAAPNLVAGDRNGAVHARLGHDVFVRDRLTGATTRVSTDSGTELGGPSRSPVISGDGSYVFFRAAAPELGEDGWYRVSRTGGTPQWVPYADTGLVSSHDGRAVAFVSWWSPDSGAPAMPAVARYDFGSGRRSWVPGITGTDTARPAISADGRHVAVARISTAAVTIDVFDAIEGTTRTITTVAGPAWPALSGDATMVAYGGAYGVPVLLPTTTGGFVDTVGSIFATDIEWLRTEGITLGCNPPSNNRFCPDLAVTRGQMAAFLTRALGLSGGEGSDRFTDDDGSIFEVDIERIAAAGITLGCNPPAGDWFCPDLAVTRGQMAAFLYRALG